MFNGEMLNAYTTVPVKIHCSVFIGSLKLRSSLKARDSLNIRIFIESSRFLLKVQSFPRHK